MHMLTRYPGCALAWSLEPKWIRSPIFQPPLLDLCRKYGTGANQEDRKAGARDLFQHLKALSACLKVLSGTFGFASNVAQDDNNIMIRSWCTRTN